MVNAFNIQVHYIAKCNHKAIWVKRFYWVFNHSATLIGTALQKTECFVEAAMISGYTTCATSMDDTNIVRIIPAIGHLCWSLMNINLAHLAHRIDNAGNSTVSYIMQVSQDTRFSSKLVMWLAGERR